MSADTIIEVKEITRRFSDIPFSGVNAVSFSITRGDIVSIVGESGSGKSTLLKLIYGLISPESGTVLFRGEEVRGPEKKLIPGNDSMKMVTQDFNLNIYAKVYDNIASMLSNTNLILKAEKTGEMLRLLRIEHLANKRVVDLSGGEQQRVAIARAIITEPEVLLMDEPFSQVDAMLKSQLRADIRRLSKTLGITVILVSHDPADGLSLSDKMLVLNRGELLEHGSPHELYSHPRNVYTARLLADCTILSREEALKVGITASTEQVAVYTENVITDSVGEGAMDFCVKDIFYIGFAEELLLEREGVSLRALNFRKDRFKSGDTVRAAVAGYHLFNTPALIYSGCREGDHSV